HIVGHDDIPGPTNFYQPRMHWDPGPFWNWAHYMALLGAPITATATRGDIVTIAPDFATNTPQVRDCEQSTRPLVAAQPANFVYLYTQPSFDAPLVQDPYLGSVTTIAGTQCANDWGDKAVTGQDLQRPRQLRAAQDDDRVLHDPLQSSARVRASRRRGRERSLRASTAGRARARRLGSLRRRA